MVRDSPAGWLGNLSIDRGGIRTCVMQSVGGSTRRHSSGRDWGLGEFDPIGNTYVLAAGSVDPSATGDDRCPPPRVPADHGCGIAVSRNATKWTVGHVGRWYIGVGNGKRTRPLVCYPRMTQESVVFRQIRGRVQFAGAQGKTTHASSTSQYQSAACFWLERT